jgi:hypothetical protein
MDLLTLYDFLWLQPKSAGDPTWRHALAIFRGDRHYTTSGDAMVVALMTGIDDIRCDGCGPPCVFCGAPAVSSAPYYARTTTGLFVAASAPAYFVLLSEDLSSDDLPLHDISVACPDCAARPDRDLLMDWIERPRWL